MLTKIRNMLLKTNPYYYFLKKRFQKDFNVASDECYPIIIGRRIRLGRILLNQTQKDLSGRTGISQTRISRLEQGKASPSPNELLLLTNSLFVPHQWFLYARDLDIKLLDGLQ